MPSSREHMHRAVFPPSPVVMGRVRDWIKEHPGATTAEIAAGMFPGKLTAQQRVSLPLAYLSGRCMIRSEGGGWYAS